MNTSQTEFEQQLKNQIRKLIRTWRADGTVSASIDCLMQSVRPPSPNVAGAPQGTNARYFYAQLFRQACQSSPDIARFVNP